MPHVFLDTETTGLHPDDCRIIQIYAEIPQLGVSINLEPHAEDAVLEPMAFKVNGRTPEEVTSPDRISQKEACVQLGAWIHEHLKTSGRNGRAQIVAHNAPFDQLRVEKMFAREGVEYRPYFHYDWECTQKLFLPLRNHGLISPPSLKLKDLAFYFGLDMPTHEAGDDVRTTIQLYGIYYGMMQSISKDLLKPRIKARGAR